MKFTIRNARLAFPQLFEAKAGGDGDKARFSASLIIPSNDPQVAAINAAIDAVAEEKWGAKAATVLKALRASDKVCLRDGDGKAQYAGFEGNMFVSAGSYEQPKLRDRDGKTEVTQRMGRLYSGVYCNAVIDIWPQDNSNGKRVNAALLGVQYVKDGEAFGGGARASDDDFPDLGVDEDALDDLC